jgi:hypothetical protein
VSINDSSSVIWKITREYLNYDERYCVLGVMSDGKCIRGVPVPSCVAMWVTWQLYSWRAGAITCCDVGDMVTGYVALRGHHLWRFRLKGHGMCGNDKGIRKVVYRYVAYRCMEVDRWNLLVWQHAQ